MFHLEDAIGFTLLKDALTSIPSDFQPTNKRTKMKYKNIVFDLGNVLVKLDEEATMHAFEQLGWGQYDHIRENPEGLKLFQDMGLGLISNQHFFDAFRRMTGSKVTDRQITDATNAMLLYIPDAKKQKLLQLRKEGIKTFLLSNTIDLHWRFCVDHLFPMDGYGVNDYFEQTFVSQEMHMKKPNDDIFQQVIKETAINPAETLFIDDLEVNCLAAEHNGFHTFQTSISMIG